LKEKQDKHDKLYKEMMHYVSVELENESEKVFVENVNK